MMIYIAMDGHKKWSTWVWILVFSFFFNQISSAQILPGLEGEALVNALRDEYKPTQLLNDTQVKDTLYGKVFIDHDTVRCIYTALARYLPSGVDPSQWLYGSGIEVGSINLEHSWPQAKGAGQGTNGNMDMHHLFPSRTDVNATRGDFPYAEINDNTTQKWYYLDLEMSSKPNTNIDAYSEYKNGFFEPRESSKGDIARALFYFWTMYRDDAVAADPLFFDMQRDVLCQWHEQDPVDSLEALRNERIATYQGGKLNPFILDCSLVRRAYCSELPACEMTSTAMPLANQAEIRFISEIQSLIISGEEDKAWRLDIFDLLGRRMYTTQIRTDVPSEWLPLPSGFYIAQARYGHQMIISRIYIP